MIDNTEKGPSITYVGNKSPSLRLPLPPVHTCTFSSTSSPFAYVRIFNAKYYPLLVTLNRKVLEIQKMFESF